MTTPLKTNECPLENSRWKTIPSFCNGPLFRGHVGFRGCIYNCVCPFCGIRLTVANAPTDRSMGMFFSRCVGYHDCVWSSLRSLNRREESCLLYSLFLQRIDPMLQDRCFLVCCFLFVNNFCWSIMGHQKCLRMWIRSTKSKVTSPYITMAILILMGGISSWRARSVFDPFIWPVHLIRPKHHSRLGLGEYQKLGTGWC